jgi:hypothetical protein
MSNVEKGDLARIVRPAKGFRWTEGRIVRIAERCTCAAEQGLVYWKFEEQLREPGRVPVQCCNDACLVRIPPLSELDQTPAPPVEVTA